MLENLEKEEQKVYDTIVSEFNQEKGLENKLNYLIQKKEEIKIDTQDEERLTTDILTTDKETYLIPDELDIQSSTSNNLRVKDNPVAKKILKTGEIDLSDKEVKVDSGNLEELSILGLQQGEIELDSQLKDLRQASVGSVEVLPEKSISLADVDPESLPEDLDILIEPEQKEMILLGKRTDSGRSGAGAGGNQPGLDDFQSVQKVSNKIFDEKSEDEINRKYTFFFDFQTNFRSRKENLSLLLRLGLFGYFGFCLIETFLEVRESKLRALMYEQQEMDTIEGILRVREAAALDQLRELVGVDSARAIEVKSQDFDLSLDDLDAELKSDQK